MAGRSNTISTSKIRKMIVIRKNRSENGIRWLLFLSKPHSKGELFSRFVMVFLARTKEIPRTAPVKTMIIVLRIEIGINTSPMTGRRDWKSRILAYIREVY